MDNNFLIPDKIGRFNAYLGTADQANKLLGITDEITLPTFSYMSETLNLAGMAGEIDSPAVGQLQSTQIEITFSNISMQMMNLAADDSKMLVLRAEQEFLNRETLAKELKGRAISIKGFTKQINYGSLKKGGYGKPSITKEVVYYKDVVDGEVITEVDKINGSPFTLNGVNMAAATDSLI